MQTPDSRINASRVFGPGSRRRFRGLIGLGAVCAAAAIAGCGGSSHPAPDAKVLNDPNVHRSSSLQAQELAMHEQVQAAESAAAKSKVTYGHLPAYLPKSVPSDRTLDASIGHPALSVQGEGVMLSLPNDRSVYANATGPDVPDSVQGTGAEYLPVTFQVSFAKAHGTIPLSQSMFKVTDEIGQIVQPKVTLPGGGRLPATIPAGQSLNLKVYAYITAGDGKVVYTPAGTRDYLAEWDFSLEDD